jgi:tRNA(Arg) A34 adenosine deaminase TadA
MIDPEELMTAAIAACRRGVDRGQTPFGCAVAVGDRIVGCCHNTVRATYDVAAHAEINALREATQSLRTLRLEQAIVAATCEPCPMCLAALHRAGVALVYFGADVDDARRAGFGDMQAPSAELLRLAGSPLRMVGGVMAEECRSLFAAWSQRPPA